MANCPNCQSRDTVTLDRTGKTVFIPATPGTYSLSGVQMKISNRRVEVFRLACDPSLKGCGFKTEVYIDGDTAHSLPRGVY